MIFKYIAIPIGFPGMKHFGIGDIVLASSFVEEVKEPLDGWRHVLVDCQNGAEEIDDVLLDCAFS